MSLDPIASVVAGPVSPAATPPYAVISKNVTAVLPPGNTETRTTTADGVETTVITNATGGTLDTIYGTSTIEASGSEISLWA
ncbi:hypothetical protein [Acidisoma sp.]|uniref:hypothetical protein n=1 Tax=Acidisoma sp. TaxID=1872115 RepID=UPI003B00A190